MIFFSLLACLFSLASSVVSSSLSHAAECAPVVMEVEKRDAIQYFPDVSKFVYSSPIGQYFDSLGDQPTYLGSVARHYGYTADGYDQYVFCWVDNFDITYYPNTGGIVLNSYQVGVIRYELQDYQTNVDSAELDKLKSEAYAYNDLWIEQGDAYETFVRLPIMQFRTGITFSSFSDGVWRFDDGFSFDIDTIDLNEDFRACVQRDVVSLYQDALSDAYDAGYAAGVQNASDAAYEEGRAVGQQEGKDSVWWSRYNEGYQAGQTSMVDNSSAFITLLGAIADVPGSILNSLSPLVLWGVPLVSIIVTLVFILLVAFIVKRFI